MRFLLSTLLGLASLAALTSSTATVESRVECHTSYGSKKTTWWLKDICYCSIDGFTLVLSCDCNGKTVLQTDDQDVLYAADSLNSGYDAVTLVVQPLLT